MSYAEFEPEAVAQVGRVPERARYKLGASSAREHAAELAGFILDQSTGHIVEGPMRQLVPEELSRWEPDPSFPEVPTSMLKGDCWRSVVAGPWKSEEDILIIQVQQWTCRPLIEKQG